MAGSDPQGRIGQSTRAATLLVKVACEAAVGKRPYLSIFGTDYPTPDGTGVRDYIHVEDLATAHLNALDYLRAGGTSLIANCGYGHGYSVREVLSSVEKIAGIKLDVREEPRRAGDPPALVAKCDRVRELLELAAAARRHRHHRAHLARVGKASAAGTLVARRPEPPHALAATQIAERPDAAGPRAHRGSAAGGGGGCRPSRSAA